MHSAGLEAIQNVANGVVLRNTTDCRRVVLREKFAETVNLCYLAVHDEDSAVCVGVERAKEELLSSDMVDRIEELREKLFKCVRRLPVAVEARERNSCKAKLI